MYYNVHIVGVAERYGCALKSGIIKVPLRRNVFPDELVKIVPVGFITGEAAFGSKIILIPPSPNR